jgi:hypothetical protein
MSDPEPVLKISQTEQGTVSVRGTDRKTAEPVMVQRVFGTISTIVGKYK